jgi:GNAT superfamily N-acetyltransferase
MPIRRANSDDAGAVYELVVGMATSFRPQRDAFERAFEAVIDTPSAVVLVAVDEARVAGYLLGFMHETFYVNGLVGWVEEMAVAQSHRRQGFGRALMSAFEQWAKDHDVRLVGLATRRASDFYQALGYEASATYYRLLLHDRPGHQPRLTSDECDEQ